MKVYIVYRNMALKFEYITLRPYPPALVDVWTHINIDIPKVSNYI